MKQKITITVIMVLLTMFAFGQITEVQLNENLKQNRFEKYYEALKLDVNHYAIQLKNRNLLQCRLRNSTNGTKQKLDSFVTQYWDETSSKWITSYKEEYFYVAKGNNIQNLNYDWDETTSQWIARSKDEYLYDANGNMIQKTWYSWDKTTIEWIIGSKKEYTYDAKGNNIQNLNYDWDETTSQWIARSKDEYSYDANGNMIQYIEYEWDKTANQWVPSYKYEYTYDVNSNMMQSLTYLWDETTSQWEAWIKCEYSYDTNGNVIQNLEYDWDEATMQWYVSEKAEYIYDATDNMIQYFYYWWVYSHWVALVKYDYTYNNSYSLSDLILPYYYNEEGILLLHHMLISGMLYAWDESSNQWETRSKYSLHYSDQNVSSLPEIGVAEVDVYPNPVSENLFFNFPDNNDQITFELFDLGGHKVLTRELKSAENISLDGLNIGVYIYKLITDGKKQSGKLIKE